MAPEVIVGPFYTQAIDWWSAGCVACEMLTGFTPFFEAADVTGLVRRILYDTIVVPEHEHVGHSEAAFLSALLTRDPELRLGSPPHGAAAVLAHEWLVGLDGYDTN